MGALFCELAESAHVHAAYNLWKVPLLEECKFYAADDVAARISGRTCDMDLSPNCRRIALEKAKGRACAVNVFEASLERKDADG